jgi:hypothetical protein
MQAIYPGKSVSMKILSVYNAITGLYTESATLLKSITLQAKGHAQTAKQKCLDCGIKIPPK